MKIGLIVGAFFCLPWVISAQPNQLQSLPGHRSAAMDHLTPLRRLHGTNVLRLAIGLPLRNREGLTNLLERLYDPGSPEYRHYLTPEQFTERFGPSREDYQAVSNFALAHGLTVTAKHPNRALLDVSAPAATVEKAFHVVLHEYQHPKENRTFFAPDVEPSVELAVPILQVSGLNNYALPKPRFKVKPANKNQTTKPNAGSGTNGGYMGNDFRAAYVPDTSLTGAGQSVGLLQFDGYTASDITNYENQAGLPNVTVTNVLLDGFNGAPTGTGGEVEVSLDIEMTISMAPGLNKVIVYEAGPTGDWYDLLNRMATDNQAKQLSCSWYQPNGLKSPVADGIFQQMIAQGQSFFNASGDHDAFTGLIDFPGDSPYITQVGGTLLTTSTNGGPWVSEEVWNRDNDIGSGGGISTQYPIPSWQTNISMANNQGSTTMRNVPDVALTADDIYVRADGIDLTVGGTSCAAPLWAGFMALVNQQAAASGRTPVGFINPAISAIGLESGYSQAFHDITVGANTNSASPTQFIAVPGYDLATGWGSPNGQALINALATPDALSISPVTGFTVSGGPTGPFANTTLTLTLTNTGTNNLIWTLGNTVPWLDISPNGGGTLTRGGPSSSVTVSLNAATSNLVAGTHSAKVWFTNLNDGVGVSRTFTLNIIEVPTITSQPTNVSLLVGGTASFRVAVVGRKPFSYQWFFNTDSLPDATNATLTLSNVATNQSGSYSVVVTNTNGSATSVAAMLTVIPKAINDLCSGAIDISVNNYINTQTTTNATSAGDPVPDCVDHFDQGVWYRFTAPTDGQLVVSAFGSGFSPGLGVFSGTCESLTPMSCNVGSSSASFSNSVTAGTTSFFLAGGAAVTGGSLTFLLAFTPTTGQPTILLQPQNEIVLTGGGATFTVNAIGTLPLNYFWERDGTAIAGATNSNYTIDNLQLADSGSQFSCLVSNSLGTMLSSNATVTFVAGTPELITFDDLAGNGQVVPAGYHNLTWTGFYSLNGQTYSPPNGYTAGVVSARNVIYGGSAAQTSINFATPFNFLSAYLTAAFNDSLQVEVQGYNGGTLTYDNFYTLSAAAPTLIEFNYSAITSVQFIASGGTLHPGYGTISEPYFAMDNASIFLLPTPPSFTTQPVSQTVPAGASAAFSAGATAWPPSSFFWERNGTVIAGATNTSYTINNVQFSDSGSQISCLASNAAGTQISANAILTVQLIPPTITTQPVSQTVAVTVSATFSVAVSSQTPLLSYQWQRNGAAIAGANNSKYTFNNAQLADSGSLFSCLVSNASGPSLSSNAVLTVQLILPIITRQPASKTVGVGASATFSVAVSSPTSVSYQWQRNGAAIAGATNSNYTINNAQLTNSGTQFSCLVSNASGSVLSANAVLTAIILPSDYFTELFGASITNLAFHAYTFTPDGSTNFYSVCNQTVTAFLTDPTGGTIVNMANDGFSSFALADGKTAAIYRTRAGMIFIGSNGYLTMNSGDSSSSPTYANHFLLPRVSALYRDLNPKAGGTVTWKQLSDRVAITFQGVPIAGSTTQTNSFQFELFFDGRIRITYLGLNTPTGLVGLSSGDGQQANFIASDFTTYGSCPPQPPMIGVQPASQAVVTGGTGVFAVTASGTDPMNYSWSRNGSPIAGATDSSYAINNVQLSDFGSRFSCLVSNTYGTLGSSNAVMTVVPFDSRLLAVDFESGLQGFTLDNNFGSGNGLWHLSVGRASNPGHSASTSLYYGQNEGPAGGGTYNNGIQNGGAVISPPVTLPSGGLVYLSFNYLLSVEATPIYDLVDVEVSTNDGASYATIATKNSLGVLTNETSGLWVSNSVDLSAFAGSTIRLRWRFDTVNASFNNTEGWYLDDIAINNYFLPPFRLQTVTANNETISFSWNAVAGQNYQVQSSTNLDLPNWTDLGGILSTTNSVISFTNINTDAMARFYRVLMLTP